MMGRFLFAFLLMPALFAAAAEEWPEFRGPNGNGYVPDAKIPTNWSESEAVTWKVPVPGEGFSSPVISGNQLWLTTALVEQISEEEQEARAAELTTNPRGIQFGGKLSLRAICYDTESGRQLHDVECFQFPSANPKHATNSYASPTPVLSQGKVFCHFGDYGTCAIDASTGKLLWTNQELHIEHQNGPGSSPVIWQDKLIVHFDGTDSQFLAAFDAETGDIAWKTMRSGPMPEKEEFCKAYCTPALISGGQDQLISPAADWVYGYDPKTGKELWRAAYGDLGFSTVPRPIVGDGLVFICTSFMRSRLLAVDYSGSGDVSETHIRWTYDRQVPQKPSLLLHEGNLYLVGDKGIATCLDSRTGEVKWQERISGQYSASPLFANGLIYLFNAEGLTTIIKPGDSYEVVAENRLDEGFMASPAVKGNSLFLRTEGHLYRID
ncbi:MAG: PQQ-binding-like beta-propeller repeat protein [Rubinisphaera brasiliensis]|uniref:PQQ-binding-like beta-propeller repeat protein n=1 Tax=Rubinisphaera brasiliensis TaxID=119 RepID=UPI00391DFEDB